MMSHQELQQQQEAGKEGMEEVAAVGTTERVCYVHCNFCNTVLAVSVPSSSMYTMVTVRCGHCANLLSVNMGGLIIAPPPPQPPAAAAAPSLYPNNNSLLPCSQPNTASTALPLHDHHQVESSLENEKEQVGFEEGLITTTNNNNSSSASSTSGSSKYSSSSSGKQQVVAVSPPLPNGGAAHQPPSPLEYSWVDDHHHHHHEPPRLPPIRPPEKRQRVPSAYNRFIKEEIQRIKASNPEISHREAFSTAAKNWAHFPHIHFGLKLEGNKNKHAKLGDHHHQHQHHHHFHQQQQQQQPYGGSAADNNNNNNNSTGTLLFNNHKKTPNNSSNNNSNSNNGFYHELNGSL